MGESIPKPLESGSDGSQESGSIGEMGNGGDPLGDLPIVTTIKGIASSNTRAFGSETASALISGITAQLSGELWHAREEIRTLRAENRDLSSKLAAKNEVVGRLEERLEANTSQRHLRNVAIAVGTFALTFGIDSLVDNKYPIGAAACLIGGILIVSAWISLPGVKSK